MPAATETTYEYVTTYDQVRVTALMAEGYILVAQFGDEVMLKRAKK